MQYWIYMTIKFHRTFLIYDQLGFAGQDALSDAIVDMYVDLIKNAEIQLQTKCMHCKEDKDNKTLNVRFYYLVIWAWTFREFIASMARKD